MGFRSDVLHTTVRQSAHMDQLATRLLRGTLVLTLSASAPCVYRQPTDSRIVAALVPIIDSAKRDSLTRVVVDSAQLAHTMRLNTASITKLSMRVAKGIKIGTADNLVECRGKAGRFCHVVRIEEWTDHGDSIIVRAGWSPFIGCGSYAATFKVSLRGDSVTAVTLDDVDRGHCGGA